LDRTIFIWMNLSDWQTALTLATMAENTSVDKPLIENISRCLEQEKREDWDRIEGRDYGLEAVRSPAIPVVKRRWF